MRHRTRLYKRSLPIRSLCCDDEWEDWDDEVSVGDWAVVILLLNGMKSFKGFVNVIGYLEGFADVDNTKEIKVESSDGLIVLVVSEI